MLLGFVLAAIGLPLLTWLLSNLRTELGLPSVLLLFLLLVVAISAVGGVWPALSAAVVGFLLVNWYFTPPIHTFTIEQGENLLALSVFLTVAAVMSTFVSSLRAGQPTERAPAPRPKHSPASPVLRRSRCSSTVCAGSSRSMPVAVFHKADAGWTLDHGVGTPVPDSPTGRQVELDDLHVLALTGRAIDSGADNRILEAFARELASSIALEELPGGGIGGRGSRRRRRAAHRDPRRRFPRPSHTALRDQGIGDAASCRTTSTGRPRRNTSSSSRSTRSPTASTPSSATCST